MSNYNTAVFVTPKSIVVHFDVLPTLPRADKVESNQARTVHTWNWVESNQLAELYNWMRKNDDLEEYFLFLRTGESDEDVEVIGTYPCDYRIGIICPESEPDNSAAVEMARYIVEFEYDSFYDHLQQEYYPDSEDRHETIKMALEDEDVQHAFKTAYMYLRENV